MTHISTRTTTQVGTDISTEHTTLLTLRKRLFLPHKIHHRINHQPLLPHPLIHLPIPRHHIPLIDPKPNRLPQNLLPIIPHNHPRPPRPRNLHPIKPQPSQPQHQHRLPFFYLSSAHHSMISSHTRIRRHRPNLITNTIRQFRNRMFLHRYITCISPVRPNTIMLPSLT